MKKNLYISIVAMLLLILSTDSCKKDNKTTPTAAPQYSMNFTLTAGTTPIVPGAGNIINNAPYRYFVNQLQYYIGDARLEKADGSEVSLSNLFLVEYNSFPLFSPNAIYGANFSFSIPAGSYTGIKFGIGVPPQILDTIAHWHWHKYTPLDPLDVDYGMPWTMYPSIYNIFRDIAIDVEADTSVSQNQPVNRDYIFHLLKDQDTVNLYHEIVLPDAFTVSNGDAHSVTVNVDFNKVLFTGPNPIDLRNVTGTDMFNYDSTGIALGETITRNFDNSITLKQN